MGAHPIKQVEGMEVVPRESTEKEAYSHRDVRASTVTLDQQPVHPIPVMQGPFEESISESMERPETAEDAPPRDSDDAKVRRQRLLEDDEYNPSYNAQWKKKPGSQYHPLLKIVAQIAFGVHLLHQRLAKSDEEVVRILQNHVDEVDTFLERATEDFELALADIKERINYLKLPLEHVNTFDLMLDNKKFRMSILEGNEKIETIMDRTARAMNDSLVDVANGLEATEELDRYLSRLGVGWTRGHPDLTAIYKAMRGNAEGWYEAFRSLQMKGNSLSVAIVQLGSILNEMSKRAGAASRRSIQLSHGHGGSGRGSPRVASPPPISRYATQSPTPADKPLPQDPGMVPPAIRGVAPRVNSPQPSLSNSPRASPRVGSPALRPAGSTPRPPVERPKPDSQWEKKWQNPRQQPKPPHMKHSPQVRPSPQMKQPPPMKRPPTIQVPPPVAELPGEGMSRRNSRKSQQSRSDQRPGPQRSSTQKSHFSVASSQTTTSAIVPIRFEGILSPASPTSPAADLSPKSPKSPKLPLAQRLSKRLSRDQATSPSVNNDSAYSSGSDTNTAHRIQNEVSPTDPSSKPARLLGIGMVPEKRRSRKFSADNLKKGKPVKMLGLFPNNSSVSQNIIPPNAQPTLQPEHGIMGSSSSPYLDVHSPSQRDGAQSAGSVRRQASFTSFKRMLGWKRSGSRETPRPLSGVLEDHEPTSR